MEGNENDMGPTTTPLYVFTGDHVILKGIIKLAVIVGEHPRVSTMMTEFLVVNYPSSFNGVIGRCLLKSFKVVTSIYHLTMKFSISEGTCQVKRGQYDSRYCYNKSFKLAKREKMPPQMMEVGAPIIGLIETNIDLHLEEDELIAGPIKELLEIHEN